MAGWPPLGWQGKVVVVSLWVNLSQQTSFGAPWIPALLAMSCFILIPFDRNVVMICCCNQACDGLFVGVVFVCNRSMPDMPDMPIHILSNTFTQIFH